MYNYSMYNYSNFYIVRMLGKLGNYEDSHSEEIFSNAYMAGFVAATAILLAVMSIFAYGPNQVSAQITPSNFQSSDTGA